MAKRPATTAESIQPSLECDGLASGGEKYCRVKCTGIEFGEEAAVVAAVVKGTEGNKPPHSHVPNHLVSPEIRNETFCVSAMPRTKTTSKPGLHIAGGWCWGPNVQPPHEYKWKIEEETTVI